MRLSTFSLLIGTVVLTGGAVAAFNLSMQATNNAAAASTNRRDFLAKSSAAIAASASVGLPKVALADDADPYADYITTESGMKYFVTKPADKKSIGDVLKLIDVTWFS